MGKISHAREQILGKRICLLFLLFFFKTECHEWAKQKMPEGKHNSKEIVNMNKYPRAWGGMQYTYIKSMYINTMCYLLDIGTWNPI